MRNMIKKKMRQSLACLLALCLVLGLNPAAALAADYEAGMGDYTDHSQPMSSGGTAETNVQVAVVTKFRVQIDSTEAIAIKDQSKLANGDYSIAATMEDGTGSQYSYYWTRQVWQEDPSAPEGGAFVADQEYNSASQAKPKTVQPDSDGIAHVVLNLADDAATLDLNGDARYMYTITAVDSAGLTRTAEPGVLVSCSLHYKDQTLHADAAGVKDGIGVRGLIHVGAPKLFATDLMAVQAPSMNMLLAVANGMKIDSAYDLVITEQQAQNDNEPAYLTPLTSVRIPVSSAVGGKASVLRFISDATGATKVEVLSDLTVHEEDGVRFVQVEGLENLAPSVFAVAYEDARAKVKITSDVAEQSGVLGGSIHLQGTHEYAQGTKVRFVFSPDPGYELEKVVVSEGSSTGATYQAGDPALGPNYIDYTTAIADSPQPVHITVYFKKADTQGKVDPVKVVARVGDGEGAGSVFIDGGVQNGAEWSKSVLPGTAVKVSFSSELGSVLDYIEIITGTEPNQTKERPAVLNSTYILAAVTQATEVVAHFKFGTPVVTPLLTVECASAQHGTLAGGGEVYFGNPISVQVRPDSGYKLESIWYVYESDPTAKRELQSAGAGSYVINSVTENCKVFATFIPIGNDTNNPNNPDDPNKPSDPNNPGNFGDPNNPSDPNNPNNPGDPNNPNGPGGSNGSGGSGDSNGSGGSIAGQVMVTSSSSGHGSISPEGSHAYMIGATAIYTLKPEAGYQPVSVTITDDLGKRTVATTSTTYTLVVERTCQIVANFQPIAAAGSNSAVARGVRTLQSLAKTGDNASAMLLALAALICGATGFAIVSRRRKDTESELETEAVE